MQRKKERKGKKYLQNALKKKWIKEVENEENTGKERVNEERG